MSVPGKQKNTEVLPSPRIPVSTYRLQFSRDFTFRQAEKIIPYLDELGISDIYASPYLKAKEGSLHGYDVVDPRRLNPEVGTEEDYERMIAALRSRGMGQLLDIVPNHMGISGSDNRWWMDVLENGPGAVHAPYFDINWTPVAPELHNKVLIPVLGEQYGNVLDKGELRLSLEEGSFFIDYWENRFPLRPKSYDHILEYRLEILEAEQGKTDPHVLELKSIITQIGYLPLYTEVTPRNITERYREKEIVKRRIRDLMAASPEVRGFLEENVRIFNGVPGDSRSFDLLDRLLSEQIFRLAHWRVATEEINYRRFFDINEMAAVHVEFPHVFRDTHSLILRLVREGKVTGLRVDHPDGLYNPTSYFHSLQKACFVELLAAQGELGEEEAEGMYEATIRKNPKYRPMYIVGEKILMPDEKLREDWPIYSTTGYIFSHYLNGIFVAGENAGALSETFASFTGEARSFEDIVYSDKKLIMSTMASEINMLGHYLDSISEADRHTRDFTRNSLTTAITEIIAHFPVYRTYTTPAGINEADREYIETAVQRAKDRNPGVNASIFNFLRDVLLLRHPEGCSEEERRRRVDFVMKFQQLTGPFMAKGMEDTSFYVYNRLISLNDVGGNPARFGESLEAFHRQNMERCRDWPHSLLASSTHDSKRGEDVRARINVISELPKEWSELVKRWSRLNAPKKQVLDGRKVPSPNAEYFLYQTLVGVSPAGPIETGEYEELKRRVKESLIKGAREAKRNTSWINPNSRYEEALVSFIDAIMSREPGNRFLYELEEFLRRLQPFGLYNSLSQTLLKITSPGIPDFYQGTEIWSYTLVDPDNRRAVDYELGMNMLNELKAIESRRGTAELASELLQKLDEGKTKLYVTWKALRFRRENSELFASGDYEPLQAVGEMAGHVCAFSRMSGNREVIVAVPRFLVRMLEHHAVPPVGADVWKDYFLVLRHGCDGGSYRNVFTGETVQAVARGAHAAIYLSDLFATFPLALLERLPKPSAAAVDRANPSHRAFHESLP